MQLTIQADNEMQFYKIIAGLHASGPFGQPASRSAAPQAEPAADVAPAENPNKKPVKPRKTKEAAKAEEPAQEPEEEADEPREAPGAGRVYTAAEAMRLMQRIYAQVNAAEAVKLAAEILGTKNPKLTEATITESGKINDFVDRAHDLLEKAGVPA